MTARAKNKIMTTALSVAPAIFLFLVFLRIHEYIELGLLFLFAQSIGPFVNRKYFYIVGAEYFILGFVAFVWIAFPEHDGGGVNLFFDNDYIRFILAGSIFFAFCWIAAYLLKVGD
jgi:hypothetical protein